MKSAVLKTKLKMQKHITKFLILTIILTAALSVNYLFAAWVGPTQAPPGGNTSTPIHVGSTNQVKDGGLSLDALSVFGGGYFQGNVGVGVVVPTEALDVSGGAKISEGLQIGNTTNTQAGTIRWTGIDLEVYNGSAWASLTGGEAAPAADPDYTDCINAGGSWVDAQSVCYFPNTSCPSGWTQKGNYSSTIGKSGGNKSARKWCNSSPQLNRDTNYCSTGQHFRSNVAAESCRYRVSLPSRNACGWASLGATKTEIGCEKN